MKILAVSAQKPEATGSGIYLTETVRALQGAGHTTAVLAGVSPSDRVLMPSGVRFFPVYYESEALPFPVCGMSDEMPYKSTVYRTMTPEMLACFRRAFGDALTAAVREFQPDVLLSHHLYILTAHIRTLFPTLPVWGVCHGTDLRQMYENPLAREEIIAGIRGLDRIFCLFPEQENAVFDCFGAERERILTVGSGYNADIFSPRPAPPHGETRLIFAGKISEKKGVLSLIRALSYLPDSFTLTLAGGWGTEEQRERTERLIAASGRRVTLAGRLSQERLAALFCESDVFVLPSFFEGMPLVLAEAMACGLNAVCTELPGIRTRMDAFVPRHGIEFVQPPAMQNTDTPRPEELPAFERRLADAIRAAAEKPKTVRDLSAFSWEGVVRRMLDN